MNSYREKLVFRIIVDVTILFGISLAILSKIFQEAELIAQPVMIFCFLIGLKLNQRAGGATIAQLFSPTNTKYIRDVLKRDQNRLSILFILTLLLFAVKSIRQIIYMELDGFYKIMLVFFILSCIYIVIRIALVVEYLLADQASVR